MRRSANAGVSGHARCCGSSGSEVSPRAGLPDFGVVHPERAELNFLAIFSRSSRSSTHVSTKPHAVQMNHDERAAPKIVRFIGINVPHVRLRETLISVELHFGQTPVFFNATSSALDDWTARSGRSTAA